jgi:hypothetical protein
VKVPQVQSAEERAALQANLAKQKAEAIKPLVEKLSKYDKFTAEIEEGKNFEFITPDEYKNTIPEMVKAYFVDGGMEPTEENVAVIRELIDAQLLHRHFKQIYKTIEADVQARERAERDKLLNNTEPINTGSAAELETDDTRKFSQQYGIGKLLGKGKK